jgi:hypothetical protein
MMGIKTIGNIRERKTSQLFVPSLFLMKFPVSSTLHLEKIRQLELLVPSVV